MKFLYDAHLYNLSHTTLLLGYLNCDGVVNRADFDLWMNNFGKTSYQGSSDLNEDGKYGYL